MTKTMAVLAHRDFGGKGRPALVILHGLLGSSRNWQTAGRDLAQHFHVHAPDLRNHGDSFHADAMDYATLKDDVLAWMDTQGIERAHLMGHSLGGKIAMRLACEHPLRVERLVVVDIAPKPYPHTHGMNFGAMNRLQPAKLSTRQEAEDALARDIGDWAMRKFLLTNLERAPGGAGFRWIVNLPALTAELPALEDPPLRPGDRFDGDVMFVLAGKSNYFAAGDEALAKEHFPYAKFVTIAESGHNPHFETRERFVEVVGGFLNGG